VRIAADHRERELFKLRLFGLELGLFKLELRRLFGVELEQLGWRPWRGRGERILVLLVVILLEQLVVERGRRWRQRLWVFQRSAVQRVCVRW
jgi:hypothetical protein